MVRHDCLAGPVGLVLILAALIQAKAAETRPLSGAVRRYLETVERKRQAKLTELANAIEGTEKAYRDARHRHKWDEAKASKKKLEEVQKELDELRNGKATIAVPLGKLKIGAVGVVTYKDQGWPVYLKVLQVIDDHNLLIE